MQKRKQYWEPSNSGQQQRLIKLMKFTHSFGERLELLARYSGREIDSIKKLSRQEAEELLAFLEERNDSMNRQRRKMMAYCYQMEWVVHKDGKRKADLERLNAWCIKWGIYKKSLNAHNEIEIDCAGENTCTFAGCTIPR